MDFFLIWLSSLIKVLMQSQFHWEVQLGGSFVWHEGENEQLRLTEILESHFFFKQRKSNVKLYTKGNSQVNQSELPVWPQLLFY